MVDKGLQKFPYRFNKETRPSTVAGGLAVNAVMAALSASEGLGVTPWNSMPFQKLPLVGEPTESSPLVSAMETGVPHTVYRALEVGWSSSSIPFPDRPERRASESPRANSAPSARSTTWHRAASPIEPCGSEGGFVFRSSHQARRAAGFVVARALDVEACPPAGLRADRATLQTKRPPLSNSWRVATASSPGSRLAFTADRGRQGLTLHHRHAPHRHRKKPHDNRHRNQTRPVRDQGPASQ